MSYNYPVRINLKKAFSGISISTVFLGLTSLFADISTEMLYPVLPIFLTETLKAGGSIVGIIEGIAEATQNIVQGLSGWLSDKLQKRKAIALVGYTLAALSKPLIGTASIWQQVLAGRFLDRLGTGIRSAPRDALIASSVAQENRGKAFGFEGIGDNLGAFAGPLVAIILLFYFRINIRFVFYFAVIPGLLAALMMVFVKEKSIKIAAKAKLDIKIKQFPKQYWRYLFAIGLFAVGNSSNAFLILQAKSVGLSLISTILVYAVFNLIAALISYPSGFLSDKFGRKTILLASFFIFFVTYLGFALTSNIYLIGFLFILYGLYQGIFRAVGKAYATDFVPQHLRASGVGWYSMVVGLCGLFASVVAGQLWDRINHPAVFFYGAFFAVVGSLGLQFLAKSNKALDYH